MKNIAQQIRSILTAVEPRLLQMDPEEAGLKTDPDKWSKKEILGHLIDSAANNHQRFIRAAYHVAMEFPPYGPNEWVRIQRYNEAPWPLLVTLWAAYNRHLCRVIECIPAETESSPCNIGKEQPVPLRFVVEDYLRHLRHHINKILPEEQI